MKTILYIVNSVVDSKEFDGLARHWDKSRHELVFVLLNAEPDCLLQRNVRAAGHDCTTIIYRGSRDTLRVMLELRRLMRRVRPALVHTNLLDASLIGLFIAWTLGIPRVHTRHHTLHNHKYHPGRGIWYDRIINRLSHRIIAVSHAVRQVLEHMEGVDPKKIILIHHGFELDAPHVPDPDRLSMLMEKYAIPPHDRGPLIGIVSRPFEWKGLDDAIPAFKELLVHHPRARLMLFHWGRTPFSDRYERILAELPPASWTTVQWETALDELYHVFDVFVHVPEDLLSEAFGYVYVEALTTGVPSVMTRSGILDELDIDRIGNLHLVPYKDRGAITEAMLQLLAHPSSPEQRRAHALKNLEQLRDLIGMEKKMLALHALFDDITNA